MQAHACRTTTAGNPKPHYEQTAGHCGVAHGAAPGLRSPAISEAKCLPLGVDATLTPMGTTSAAHDAGSVGAGHCPEASGILRHYPWEPEPRRAGCMTGCRARVEATKPALYSANAAAEPYSGSSPHAIRTRLRRGCMRDGVLIRAATTTGTKGRPPLLRALWRQMPELTATPARRLGHRRLQHRSAPIGLRVVRLCEVARGLSHLGDAHTSLVVRERASCSILWISSGSAQASSSRSNAGAGSSPTACSSGHGARLPVLRTAGASAPNLRRELACSWLSRCVGAMALSPLPCSTAGCATCSVAPFDLAPVSIGPQRRSAQGGLLAHLACGGRDEQGSVLRSKHATDITTIAEGEACGLIGHGSTMDLHSYNVALHAFVVEPSQSDKLAEAAVALLVLDGDASRVDCTEGQPLSP